MKLIVGLGNPGKPYEKTKHNIGFMVLDILAGNDHWLESKKAKALYLKKEMDGQTVELLKPQTYMNDSGYAVAYAVKNNNFTADDVIVVHDDKDLPLGKIKIQKDAGAAGHNGVQSIIEQLKTKNFTRIRIGIAADNPKRMNDASKFVLQKFGLLEKKPASEAVNRAAEATIKLLNSPLATVMNEYN